MIIDKKMQLKKKIQQNFENIVMMIMKHLEMNQI